MESEPAETSIIKTTSHVRTPIALPLAILFLVIALILIFFVALYYIFWLPVVPPPTCQVTNDCASNEVCQNEVCVLTPCSDSNDCGPRGTCLGSYCIAPTCLIGNDCPTGTVCSQNGCVPPGSSCVSDADCYHLNCLSGVCLQCNSDSMCPEGQGCFNGGCRYPYVGETGIGQLFYSSPAQVNGNITAPPGYFCSSQTCGTGPTGSAYIPCGLNQSCPSACDACVNSICRCVLGDLGEFCAQNTDCASGLCQDTQLGRICIPGGGQCAFNYSVTGGAGSCPTPAAPYCVNGLCSGISLGAPCGATGMPLDLCNNPSALTRVPTAVPDGMGFFCVNGTCQTQPAGLNALCTPNSCVSIETGVLTCEAVSTPTLTQFRCQVPS